MYVPQREQESMTEKADRVLTHPIWGVPVFLGIMALVFFLTFTVGDAIKGLLSKDWIGHLGPYARDWMP